MSRMAAPAEESAGIADEIAKLQLKIGGMSCSFCTATIEKALGRLDGIERVTISLAHEEGLVQYDPGAIDPDSIHRTLRDIGYTVRDPKKVLSLEEERAELAVERRRLFTALGLSLIVLFLMILSWTGDQPRWAPWAVGALALFTVFWVGRWILRMAIPSVRRGILNQHVLLEAGALAGIAGGMAGLAGADFTAGGFFAVAVFITTYHILSAYTSLTVRIKSSRAVQKLLALKPNTAHVVRDGLEREVPIEEIERGELVRVRPGESVPVDGVVREGRSTVDQALVTGEPIPEEKHPGDEVIGGSVNQVGSLLVEVSRVGEETFLAQVARQIEEAHALKPGLLQLVDRLLKYFVPGVLAIAGAAVLVWTLGDWLVTGNVDLERGVFAALAVLVLGYPCALGMATPLAMIRGGGMAAERGILMRSGEAFQVMGELRYAVFDKTGTITRGSPTVTDVVTADKWAEHDVFRLAAAAEENSEHPLARAVVSAARERGLGVPRPEDFQSTPGTGVTAAIQGKRVEVGRPDQLTERGVNLDGLSDRLSGLRAEAKTAIAVVCDGQAIGLIALADEPKPDAYEAIEKLKRAGIKPVMLTGDNQHTARAVAEQVGIDEVYANVHPGDKAEQIRALQVNGNRVAMVGDGINDAPALTQADVGFAIGAGTDIAIESSDVVLLGDRLTAVAEAHEIGRLSYRKTKQNLAIAFSLNGIGVPAAVTGLVGPEWAMLAMITSVSLVLLNSFGSKLLRR